MRYKKLGSPCVCFAGFLLASQIGCRGSTPCNPPNRVVDEDRCVPPLATLDADAGTGRGWIRYLGTSERDVGNGVAVDVSGNIYVTGYTEGSLDGITSDGGVDIFLVKYDSDGGRVWTRQLGSGTSSGEAGNGVAVDLSGNIYVTGWTSGSLDGNTNAGNRDMFLVKYDGDGGRVWTRQLGTSSDEAGNGVAVDVSGNIYVTGNTEGSLDGITSDGGVDIFLVKYDSDGGRVWTRQLGASGTSSGDEGNGVAVDVSGNIYVTGHTFGSLDGNTSAGGADIFLLSYDGDGGKRWTRQFGTSLGESGRGVAVDVRGNIFVAGRTFGSLDGNVSDGGRDIFLAKFDSDGGKGWTRQLGTLGDDYGSGVAVDLSGNIYVTGSVYGSLDGNTNIGSDDILLAKFDGDGGKEWTRQFGSHSEDWGYGVAVDLSGNVYVGGFSFGAPEGNTTGNGDVFLAKFDADGGQ